MQSTLFLSQEIDAVIIGLKAKTLSQVLANISKSFCGSLKMESKNLIKKLSDASARNDIVICGGFMVLQVRSFSLHSPFVAMVTLHDPIECDAPDGLPVSVICMVMVPSSETPGEQLRRVSRFSRLLQNEMIFDALKTAERPEEIQMILKDPQAYALAA